METLLAAEHGAYLDMIYHCPHHPERGFDGEVADAENRLRMPQAKAGHAAAAARELNIDLPGSWMIGDTDATS